MVQFIGLNPSTADETKDDPTVRRCIAFAKSWGYSAMCMTNLFAFRSTDPRMMLAEAWPVGICNDKWLLDVAEKSNIIIAAWGNHGNHLSRAAQVIGMFKWRPELYAKLHCLATNKSHAPKHPLYLRADLQPQPYHTI